MTREEMSEKLLECFPKSFINYRGEFIAHKKSNTYLLFDKCQTFQDLQAAVIEWFSRSAFKTAPYYTDTANARFHSFMLKGINQLCGTTFTEVDMELIYTYLGNAVHHSLAIEFVEKGFDLEILRAYARSKDPAICARWGA